MQVVCLEEEAFYTLFDKVVEHVEAKRGNQPRRWIDGSEVMALLNISSKTTLQKLRDNGEIRFPNHKRKSFFTTENQSMHI